MAGDSSYASVSLLLHGDGTDGSTTVTDNSPSPKTITVNGLAAIRTAQKKFGSASLRLPANNMLDFFGLTASASWKLGSAMTVECFLYLGAYNANGGRLIAAGAGTLAWNSTNGIQWLIQSNSNGISVVVLNAAKNNATTVAAVALSLSTWYHIALTWDGTTCTVWKDGTSQGTSTDVGIPSGTPQLHIGAISGEGGTGTAQMANAYLDDVRVTNACRYTGSFTPAAAAFPDGLGQVSGNVKDSGGVNAARTVRAYRRDTGALVGNTTSDASGNYSFYTPTLDEVTVIALDDQTSGTYYNDQVIRVIPA